MGDIGLRAAKAVRHMAAENRTSIEFELDCCKVEKKRLYSWENGADPCAFTLAEMLKNGYDIEYILLGEKK